MNTLSNFSSRHLPKRNENKNTIRILVHEYSCSFIHNSENLEIIQMSINRRTNK